MYPLPFLPSKSSHILLLALFHINDHFIYQLLLYAYLYVYTHGHKNLNAVYTVCAALLVCMFLGLTFRY